MLDKRVIDVKKSLNEFKLGVKIELLVIKDLLVQDIKKEYNLKVDSVHSGMKLIENRDEDQVKIIYNHLKYQIEIGLDIFVKLSLLGRDKREDGIINRILRTVNSYFGVILLYHETINNIIYMKLLVGKEWDILYSFIASKDIKPEIKLKAVFILRYIYTPFTVFVIEYVYHFHIVKDMYLWLDPKALDPNAVYIPTIPVLPDQSTIIPDGNSNNEAVTSNETKIDDDSIVTVM